MVGWYGEVASVDLTYLNSSLATVVASDATTGALRAQVPILINSTSPTPSASPTAQTSPSPQVTPSYLRSDNRAYSGDYSDTHDYRYWWLGRQYW